jgi:beta-glucosidase
MTTNHVKQTSQTAGVEDLWFMVGIECTQIVDVRPDINPDMRELEEFALLQHYERWEQDLELITRLRHSDRKVSKVRWCIPWYRVEVEPGKFDWEWTDKVIDRAVELGIELIPDIVHYGCPRWLPQAFIDPTYPDRVASFAAACVERYKGKIHHWTPFNEPAVTALFGAEKGEWPPYLKSPQGYVAVLMGIARGMQKSIRAMRASDPTATLWAAESTKNYHPVNQEAVPHCKAAYARDLIVWDLVHGKVDADHASYNWLKENGATDEALAELRANPEKLDILGLNFYPWLSQTYELVDGQIKQGWDWNGTLLVELLREAHAYTGAPVCLTETSAYGTGGKNVEVTVNNWPDIRIRWMDETMWAMEQARREGIPVLGYTQYPLFTMIDWAYRMKAGPLADWFVSFGMIEVDEQTLDRKWTPVADRFLFHMEHFPREFTQQAA